MTPDGYERLYSSQERHYDAALLTLRQQLASRSFLFVGFSFSDEHVGVELQGVADVFKNIAGPHYALVHQSEAQPLRNRSLPVEIIPFDDFGQPLLDLLEEISGFAPKKFKEEMQPSGVAMIQNNKAKPKGKALADFELHVTISPRGGAAKLDYVLNLSVDDIPILTAEPIEGPTILDWPAPLREDMATRLGKLANGLDFNDELLIRDEKVQRLATLGRELYDRLFPKRLQ